MDYVNDLFSAFVELAQAPWFYVGKTQLNLLRVLGLLFIAFFAWWMSSAVERTIRRLAKRGKNTTLSESGLYALTRILRYVIWIAGTMIGLNYIGLDLSSFALIGGAVGVGVGFGLQNVFSNLVSGVIILLEKTLKVGDFVDLQSGVVGTVTEISMRYTRITTNDSVDIIVPNSEFINGRVTNWTLDEQFRRMHVPFGVAYGSDKELVRQAGVAAAATVHGTVLEEKRQPEVWLVGFGDSSLNFELVVWVGADLTTSPSRTVARYLWAIETELGSRGIEIPFPQRDLHLRSGSIAINSDGKDGTSHVTITT
jgi:small-conductance mechanosensitive channel